MMSEGLYVNALIIVLLFFVSSNNEDFIAPCGGCRQIIYEFGYATDCTVLMVKFPGKECKKTTIGQLLPYAFGPDALKN